MIRRCPQCGRLEPGPGDTLLGGRAYTPADKTDLRRSFARARGAEVTTQDVIDVVAQWEELFAKPRGPLVLVKS